MSEAIPTGENFLAMSPWDFDQGPNGWGKLRDEGSFLKAANAIGEYLNVNTAAILAQGKSEESIEIEDLRFHQGQMLAASGEEHYAQAIRSFSTSFKDDDCWDSYVWATIAFLEGNGDKIERAIQTIENSTQKEKRQGNIEIVRSLKQALEHGVRDYQAAYSWPREAHTP